MTNSILTRFAACGLVALGLAIGQPAAAQETAAVVDPSQLAARYAACLVAERPAAVDAFLASAPGTPRRALAFETLAPIGDETCAAFAAGPDGTQLRIPEPVLTGLIAEARYIVGYPGGPPAAIVSAVPTAMSDQVISQRLTTAADPQAEFPRIFGDCVVGLRAPDVDRLIRSRPGSSDEAVLLASLQPSLGQCLWGGQTLEFSRDTLRAALADGLYRKAAGISLTVDPGEVAR